MMWAEGPVCFADLEILLLSDVPAEQILLSPKGSHRSSFAIRPATPMATPGTAKGVCSPARAAIVASSAPNLTGGRPFSPIATMESSSTRQTTSSYARMIRSGLPTRIMEFSAITQETAPPASSGAAAFSALIPSMASWRSPRTTGQAQWSGLLAHRENPFVADSGATHTPGWRT